MARSGVEYGVEKAREGKYGEFVAGLERALEVINSFELVCIYAVWEDVDRVVIMANGDEGPDVYLISFDGDSLTIPWSFPMIVDYIAGSMVAIMGEDEDIYNKRFLLSRARQMEEEKVDRERVLGQIETSFNSIFRDEVSRKAAENKVLQQWSEALGENGWVVSEVDLRELTRLPILGNDQILIYHGSARRSPRYFRVFRRGEVVVLERIWADKLAGVVRDGVEIDGMEEMGNDEIGIVLDVLARMCPQEKHK